jgi:hypothetical protein
MNTRFPGCLVGTTTNTSGTISLDSAALPFGAKLDDFLQDGQTYRFYMRWPDNVTAGWLEADGVWSSSGNGSITRAKIINSFAGVATDYTFAAGTKHIMVTTPGSELGNMASVLLSLKPWEDVLIGVTCQSNGGTLLVHQGSAPPDTTRVKDWSRTVPGTGSESWQAVVKAQQYTDYNDALPYIGTPRSVNSSGWKTVGSFAHSLATKIAYISGRLARTVVVHRGATAFADSTYGWLYPGTSTSVGKVFDDALAAAISQMHTDDPRQTSVTKLHIYALLQGETNALYGDDGSYGYQVADHLAALEDPARWNSCDSNTRYLLPEIPTPMRKLRAYQTLGVNEFNGHAQAQALFGSRVSVISTAGIPTQPDQIHYWGEGADTLGERAADTELSTTTVPANFGGAFRLVENNTWPDPLWARETDSASGPGSTNFRLNVAQTQLKIRKTAGYPGDMTSAGLGLFKPGDILRMEQQASAAIYVDCTITGLPTDNTTFFSYPCTTVIVGTQSTGSYYLKPQNTSWHDGKSYSASTIHNLQSNKQNLANTEVSYTSGADADIEGNATNNFHVLMADVNGRQYRSKKQGVRWAKLRTTAVATNTTILASYHFTDGYVEYVRARICYKVPANGNVGVFVVEGVVRRTGSTMYLDWSSVTVTVDEEALATDPDITTLGFSVLNGWILRITGKASTTIDWVCEAESIEIPTGT